MSQLIDLFLCSIGAALFVVCGGIAVLAVVGYDSESQVAKPYLGKRPPKPPKGYNRTWVNPDAIEDIKTEPSDDI